MVLGGHFLLLMLPAHLLLMMQRTHLLLVMLSGHLLLMMLSIHLLLMIHRLLPMSRAFVLDSFVVGPSLVSLNVVIVAVKIFSLVFVPVVLGPKVLPMCTAHSCSLAVMFSDVPCHERNFSVPNSLPFYFRGQGLSGFFLPCGCALGGGGGRLPPPCICGWCWAAIFCC